jgi:CheY-like chemotaxis protein
VYYDGRHMKTILFVDDNKHIREFCKREFEEDGYRVVTARDGIEAVEFVRHEIPDLIILDICMPSANGLETIEMIQAIDMEVPVVFFTAYDEDCMKDQRGRLAAACIEKSEDLTELKLAASRAIVCRSQRQSLKLGLPPNERN